MTRAKWTPAKQRVFKAAMRWYLCWLRSTTGSDFIPEHERRLVDSCAAAKAKRGKRK